MSLKTIFALAAFSSLLLNSPSTNASSFLENFYDQASAMHNSTPAGFYDSGASGTLTGGSYMIKTPRREIPVISMQAPHLKTGCGGIDLFMGAFSIPSREEFVSFLRSIGTAIPGVAFSLAMQAMAPDLNEQMSQFRDMMMHYSELLGDNCQAAEALLDNVGAKQWMQTLTQRATNQLRISGQVSDQGEAIKLTATNGEKVLNNTPVVKGSNDEIIEAPEINLTWSLLNTTNASKHFSQDEKELLMSLLGTTVFRRTGHGDNTTIQEYSLPPQDILSDLVDASPDERNATVFRYACDEPKNCLNVKKIESTEANITHRILDAMRNYRRSIIERNPNLISNKDVAFLENISSIPLLQLAEIGSSSRLATSSDKFFRIYAEASAYEVMLNALDAMSSLSSRIITAGAARHANAYADEHARHLEKRLERIRNDLRAKNTKLSQDLARVNLVTQEWQQLAKQVRGVPAIKMLNSMQVK